MLSASRVAGISCSLFPGGGILSFLNCRSERGTEEAFPSWAAVTVDFPWWFLPITFMFFRWPKLMYYVVALG